jgi:hypothetical protein
MNLNKKFKRYIEVFRSSQDEMTHYTTKKAKFDKYNSRNSYGSNYDNDNYSRGKNFSNGAERSFNNNRSRPYPTSNPNRQRSEVGFSNDIVGEVKSLMDLPPPKPLFDSESSSGGPLKSLFDIDLSMPPQQSSSSNGFFVKMRGLPFNATFDDVRRFFSPLNVLAISNLNSRVNGKPSGECECEFNNYDDQQEALKYHKQFMGSRYIEVFIPPSHKQSGNNFNNFRNGGNERNFGQNNVNSFQDQFSQIAKTVASAFVQMQNQQQMFPSNHRNNGNNRRY